MDDILTILKILINDLNNIYSDTDLNKIIVVAASFVQQEIDLDITYTINLSSPSIVPEPEDYSFINFTAMKAAIILAQGELKDSALNSFRITDGPSTIDTTQQFKSRKDYLETLLDQYSKDKITYSINSSIGGYRAIITTPTTEERLA